MGGACQPVVSAEIAQRVVLVVEDEVVLRMAVSAHLRDIGFVVIEAVDAEEAMMLLNANHKIRLVFSDINMPGNMDGDELAGWIRGRYPDIRVLLTSGVMRQGLPHFLSKPYSFIELQRRIEEMLAD